jgi:hypothetical protein
MHKLAETELTNFDDASISTLYHSAKNKSKDPELRDHYIVPMIEDINQKSPLDIVFEKPNVNVNLAWQFLFNIKEYPFMHSGPIISRNMSKAIKVNVPDLPTFFDCQMKTSGHLKSHLLAKQALK